MPEFNSLFKKLFEINWFREGDGLALILLNNFQDRAGYEKDALHINGHCYSIHTGVAGLSCTARLIN